MAQFNLSTQDMARTLNLPVNHILDILEGQRTFSPDSASRLARCFCTTPEYWLQPQKPTRRENGPHVKLVPSQRSPVSGRNKAKHERISEAIGELQLAIAGIHVQEGRQDSGNRSQTLSAFARMCSVFLRKLVLGDYGKRDTRLLDDSVMISLNMKLPRLRKIANDRRRTIRTGWSIGKGSMQFTKIDEPGPELPTYVFPIAPQDMYFSIVWPLPGTADWVGTPTDAKPWRISADQLFKNSFGRSMTCDNWLGQQLLIFDKSPVSLKEIIRKIANFEGAHAIDMSESSRIKDRKSQKKGNEAPLHLLNSVLLFGIPLPHIIVIETALFLYEQLVQEPSIKLRVGDIYSIQPGFICTPEQACSSEPDWLQFDGEMNLLFSSKPQSTRYNIKPVRR